jgi:hypothetical protein
VVAVETVRVAIVGAGQAGLAVSHELTGRDVEHVVLERGRVGQTWRGRWDSFCLRHAQLERSASRPPVRRRRPDGFLLRDELVSYFARSTSTLRSSRAGAVGPPGGQRRHDRRRRRPPVEGPGLEELDLKVGGAVVFTSGFRPDYRSRLPWPEAFDDLGFPLHANGASTVVPGLYFVGVHFLRKRKSSLILGVGEDAALIAHDIARNR